MVRRTFLIALAAVAATAVGATPEADPLDAASRGLKKRLVAFARVVALHRWSEAVGFFDPDHNTLRHKLYFSPEHNEEPPEPGNPVDQEAFVDWYLRETLGLAGGDDPVEQMDDVVALRYLGLEDTEPEGPIRVLLEVETEAGTRAGVLRVDRETLAFTET